MTNITIYLEDGVIRVEPVIPEILKKKLMYWHREMTYDERLHKQVISGSYRQLYTTKTILTDDNKLINQLYTMPGFAARIVNLMRSEGYTTSFVDNRTPTPKYDLEASMRDLRDYQREAVYNAVTSGGGLLAAPTGYGKTRVMAAIIRAYKHEELIYRNTPITAVVAADMDVCSKNYDELKKLFYKEREVGLVMTGSKEFSDDIQVITFDSLQHINPEEIGLLIVDEVHGAATDKRIDAISAMTKALKWGVSATPTGRFDGADLVTEGLFGPIIYQSTYADGVASGALVPIKICWLKAPEPAVGLTRYNNYKRRISKYEYGVERNKSLSDMVMTLMSKIPDEMQTICIMPHLQQMNELKSLNKEIKIVHGETTEAKLAESRYHELYPVSKKERREIYNQMASGEIRKILSTYVYKQGVDFPALQVMICPGGGGSTIIASQIPGRASRAGIAGKDCAYVVDFVHEWDTYDVGGKPKDGPILKDDKSRTKTYKQLGFEQTLYEKIEDLPFIGIH